MFNMEELDMMVLESAIDDDIAELGSSAMESTDIFGLLGFAAMESEGEKSKDSSEEKKNKIKEVMTKIGASTKKFCDMVMNWIKEMSQKVSDFVRTLTTKGLIKVLNENKNLEIEVSEKDKFILDTNSKFQNIMLTSLKEYKNSVNIVLLSMDNLASSEFEEAKKQMNDELSYDIDDPKIVKISVNDAIKGLEGMKKALGFSKELVDHLNKEMKNINNNKKILDNIDTARKYHNALIDVVKTDMKFTNNLYSTMVRSISKAVRKSLSEKKNSKEE